uniref:Protein kinase domain-containing protein n=1 Tax=Noctiluca scintillans TaxID=2966 RepID=A0A7S1AM37_NOCSC|mmetsp:Transcript_51981/g.138578  ORF Transcript_51981/g.138578 Transcript_51981/m.138578 type:complete len:782 (+) Transcript_51981:100-2445(+)
MHHNAGDNATMFNGGPAMEISAAATTLLDRNRTSLSAKMSRFLGHLLQVTCFIFHIFMLVCFVWQGQKYFVFWLLVLLIFDMYAVYRLRFRDPATSTFWERSFDRCIVGWPFALFTFYGWLDFSNCFWGLNHDIQYMRWGMAFAGWMSVLSIGLSATEIDFCANTGVARDMNRSIWFTLRHLALRTSETSLRLTLFVCFWLLARPFLGDLHPKQTTLNACFNAFAICVPCIFVWFMYVLILRWASQLPGMPRESCVACCIIGYVALGPNPVMFLLDAPYYSRAARRANLGFTGLRVAEVAAIAVFAFLVWDKTFPPSCGSAGTIGPSIFTKTMIIQISVSLFPYVMLFLTTPRLSSRVFFGRGGSQTIPFSSDGTTRWLVNESPDVAMATYLINQGSGSGVLARLVPMAPVNPNIYRVEKQLGQGSYGLVVCVRQEVRGQEPKCFALKLQCTGGSSRRRERGPLRSPHVLAMRERDIYRKIWEEVDEETGRLGHPFIVRLLCYSDWPREKQLFYEGTEAPVQFFGKDEHGRATRAVTKFDSALLMEFCQEGSLEDFVPLHMRRGESDADSSGVILWVDTVRRLSAEMLLALDFLHNSKSVIYRDLKLDNIFVVLDQNGIAHAKLGDFGFSKVVSAADKPISIAGSPYFAAPEMMAMHKEMKSHATDWSLDVFSAGMAIFVMLYGAEFDTTKQHWMLAHHRKYPKQLHPTQNPTHFDHALAQMRAVHGISHHADLIKQATHTKPEQRISVVAMKDSLFFGTIEVRGRTLPAIDWNMLRHLDL